MIDVVARRLGEHLTPEQHQILAAKYEAAVMVVNTMAAAGTDVHPSHLPEYLDAGHHRADGTPTYESLYAVLSYRLSEAQVRDKLPGFVARMATSGAFGGPSGGAWGAGGTAPGAVQGSRCLIHGTRYITDRTGFGLRCPQCSSEEETSSAPKPLASGPGKVLEALPAPKPQSKYGEHCGNNLCHREQRVIAKRSGERVWSEPCPVCRPGQEQAVAP